MVFVDVDMLEFCHTQLMTWAVSNFDSFDLWKQNAIMAANTNNKYPRTKQKKHSHSSEKNNAYH